MTRKALVSGATGVVGRCLLEQLVERGDWDVVALSRRVPDVAGRYTHIAVDLEDPADCRAKLGGLDDVTHVFSAAYLQDADPARLVSRNTALLVNLVNTVEAASPALEHVNLVEGTKWYGSHLGPFTTPARERHPRHAGANFYFDQQDWLEAAQNGKAWTWSAARPHAVCGFSLGSPMNLVMVLATYAAVCCELGLPFSHPGAPANWTALYQLTDAALLGRAMIWMATTPHCTNEAFNITNGDLIRWCNVWPRIADFFEMPMGDPQPRKLVDFMADKGPVWDRIVAKHGLQPNALHTLAGFAFGDFVFASTWDIVSDTGKARRHGFCESPDTELMLTVLLERFRADRVIP